jgi:hypothetical protein
MPVKKGAAQAPFLISKGISANQAHERSKAVKLGTQLA